MLKCYIENIGRLVGMKVLSNRKFKNIILLSLVVIYCIVYRTFIYTDLLRYSESINAAFMMLTSAIGIGLLGYRKIIQNDLESNFFNGSGILYSGCAINLSVLICKWYSSDLSFQNGCIFSVICIFLLFLNFINLLLLLLTNPLFCA